MRGRQKSPHQFQARFFDCLRRSFEWLANPVFVAAWLFSFAGTNKIALLLGIPGSAVGGLARPAGSTIT